MATVSISRGSIAVIAGNIIVDTSVSNPITVSFTSPTSGYSLIIGYEVTGLTGPASLTFSGFTLNVASPANNTNTTIPGGLFVPPSTVVTLSGTAGPSGGSVRLGYISYQNT